MFYKSEEYSVPGYSRSVNLIQSVTLELQEIAVYRCEVRIGKGSHTQDLVNELQNKLFQWYTLVN